MARYTRTDLDKLLGKINKALEKGGSPYRLESEGRNGYTAVDMYKNGDCLNMVANGTPREAAAGAAFWAISNAVAITTE